MPPIYKQQPQFEMRSPTALDRLVTSKVPSSARVPQRVANNLQNAFFAFAGIIVGVSVWAIWRSDPLLDSPSMDDPFGDPSEWSEPELRRWLNAVCHRESFLET
jgi:hypothetical protein